MGTCGGFDAIDIYEAVTAPCATPWTFRGCYPDTIATRTLTTVQLYDIAKNSVATCQTSCLNAGFAYAGVEDAVGRLSSSCAFPFFPQSLHRTDTSLAAESMLLRLVHQSRREPRKPDQLPISVQRRRYASLPSIPPAEFSRIFLR